ncbi:MAG: 5'-methylthioadenosine/adenosylhomocysteine nucleosidase [Bacillota bacterium]|nr:5'-methylthioadenosine/adenosylhomocysteine nucleosidase [Bacillota bacterium]
MLIGIIGAMDEEVIELINSMVIEIKTTKAMMEFNKGILWNKDVVIVKSGIGKVNAAVCTQILVDDFHVDKVINVGVAGGIKEDIYPGDIVIADSLVQHDMDTTVFGDRLGQIPRLNTYEFKCNNELVSICKKISEKVTEHNCHIGRIVTGDQFIADIDKIKWLKLEFDASACEMEGGSIAQVCYLNEIPFVVIRSISDNANNGAHMDFNKFKDIAAKNSLEILKNLLEVL